MNGEADGLILSLSFSSVSLLYSVFSVSWCVLSYLRLSHLASVVYGIVQSIWPCVVFRLCSEYLASR